jgi:hypothetical protein
MQVTKLSTDETAALSPRMSEKQVRERLGRVTDLKVANELYSLGQSMVNEVVGSIRTLESKATLFAAYGTAIVTLLVSSSATWSNLGNQLTAWISVCAGLATLTCTIFSVKSLALKKYKIVSQEEWLEAECLQSELKLKQYHILAIWSALESRFEVQLEKLRELRSAQRWLQVAVAIMAFLLFQIALVKSYRLAQGHGSGVGNVLGMQLWQLICGHSFAVSCLACGLVLGLILFLVFRSDRLI